MEFVYPAEKLNENYHVVMSSFHDEDFVRIQSGDAYDSFLMALSREYQNLKTDNGREKMKITFIEQFKKFLLSPSYTTKKELHDRVVKIFNSSNLSRNFTIKNLGKSEEIFDIILVENEKEEGREKKRGFSLFSKKMKNKFSSNCNFFDMMSDEFLRDIIDFKLSKTEITRQVGELKKKEQTKYTQNSLEQKKEILNFMKSEENNLDAENLLEIIESNEMINQDLILKILSDFMKVNIFICRPWNSEISVLKKFYNTRNESNIIIYKLEGRVSVTGFVKNPSYETGGVLTNDGIITNFNNENDVVSVLDTMYQNNIESYYMEKYLNYLTNIQHQSNMCELEIHYHLEEEKGEEKGEEKEEEKETLVFLEEKGPTEIIVKEEGDVFFPPFMENYTTPQMRDELERENKDVDYSRLSERQIRIGYLNMFKENKLKDLDDIIQNMKTIIA